MLALCLLLVIITLVVISLLCCLIGFNWEYRRGRRIARQHRAEGYRSPLAGEGMDALGARADTPAARQGMRPRNLSLN